MPPVEHPGTAAQIGAVTISSPLPESPKLPRRLALLLLPLAALPGCGGPARAQRGLPDFADLAERALPAVVNIAVQSETTTVPPEFRGTPFERYFRGRRERFREWWVELFG